MPTRHAKENGELQLSVLPNIVVEKPKEDKFGDFSTSISMLLAKSEKKKPRDIAEILCQYLHHEKDQVSSVEIAGPGFINLKFNFQLL